MPAVLLVCQHSDPPPLYEDTHGGEFLSLKIDMERFTRATNVQLSKLKKERQSPSFSHEDMYRYAFRVA